MRMSPGKHNELPETDLEVLTLEWCSDDYYSVQEHWSLVKQYQPDLSIAEYIRCMRAHIAEGRVLLYKGDIQTPVQTVLSETSRFEESLAPDYRGPLLFVSITERGEDYLSALVRPPSSH